MPAPETKIVLSAEDRASATLRHLQTNLGGMSNAVRTATALLVPLGAALSLGGAVAAIKSVTDLQDRFGKLAQSTGVGVKALTELDYAAKLSDVSTDDLGTGLSRLTARMADVAQGVPDATRLFKDFGVEVLNADGTLRSSDGVFKDIAQRFSEFEDGSTKSAFAMEFFGRSGTKLIPLLNSGRDGLADMAEEARQLGVVFDDKAAKAAEEFNDNLTRLKASAEGLKIELLSGLIPQLNEVITRFTAARREGLGFIEAIDVAAGLGGFSNLDEKIAETQRALDGLRKGRSGLFGPLVFGDSSQHIAQLEARLERLQRIQRLIAGADPGTGSYGPLVEEPPVPPAAPRITPPTGGRSAKLAQADLTDEQRTLIAAIGLYTDVEKRAKDYGLTLEWLDRLYFDGAIHVEQYDVAVQQLSKSTLTLGEDGDKALTKLADRWKDAIDPTREYTRQIEEIRNLVAAGKLTKDQGIAAEFEVENARQDAMFGGMADSAKEAGNAARELGLTFQSAFEDAIIEGKKFSDVLAGIGQDLLRLTIRKSLTEPLADRLSTVLNFGSLSGNRAPISASRATTVVPTKAMGIDFVPYDNYPAFLHRGERVVTAAENRQGSAEPMVFAPQITIHGEMSRSQEARLMVQMRNVALASQADARRRGVAA